MKASMKFRDNQQSPLVRMKFLISAPGINLTSGIVLGDAEDLSLHIGTPAEASCPSMKLSYHPNDPSNGHFCLVMKIGMGPWGPPSMASLSVSAQLRFSKVSSSGPFFSVHVKPRLGDFGLRKTAKLSSSGDLIANFKGNLGMVEEDQKKSAESGHLGMDHNGNKSLNELRVKAIDGNSNVYTNTFDSHRNNAINVHSNGYVTSFDDHRDKSIDVTRHGNLNSFGEYRSKDMDLNSHEPFDDKIAHAITPLKLDKNSLFTPLPLRSKLQNGFSSGENGWANDYVKCDHFDHGYRSDRMPGFESYSNHHASEIESPRSSSVEESSIMHERGIEMACDKNNNNTVGSAPVPLQFGSHESMKGWALHAYSMIPLGKQASLSFRWGVKMHGNAFEGWDNNFSNVKIPHISLQKITISSRRCNNTELSKSGALQILGNDEEMYELSPVAALCGLMKKQVHMLYTENQVLKKAMKEMKAQFEQEIIGKPRSLRGSAINSIMDERIDGTISGAKEGKGTTMRHLHGDNRDVSTASDWLSNDRDAPKKLSIFRWIGKRKSK